MELSDLVKLECWKGDTCTEIYVRDYATARFIARQLVHKSEAYYDFVSFNENGKEVSYLASWY